MAGFTPAVGDLLEVRVVCYTPSQIALNVLHYEVTAQVGAGATLASIAASFAAGCSLLYRALMPSVASFRGIGVRNLMAPRTIEFTDAASDGVGSVGADLAPTQTSYILAMSGTLAGRSNTGHSYPGFPSADYLTATGGMTAPGLAALTALATFLFTPGPQGAGADLATLVLATRHPDVIVATVHLPQWTRVFSLRPAPIWATQRRRGQFGRQNIPPF